MQGKNRFTGPPGDLVIWNGARHSDDCAAHHNSIHLCFWQWKNHDTVTRVCSTKMTKRLLENLWKLHVYSRKSCSKAQSQQRHQECSRFSPKRSDNWSLKCVCVALIIDSSKALTAVFLPTQQYRGAYRMRIYNRPEMYGHMMEFTDDCPNVYDRFGHHGIYSCNCMEGYWIFYEHPNYRGRQYFLRPGEYRACSEWGCMNPMIGSFRRMRSSLM